MGLSLRQWRQNVVQSGHKQKGLRLRANVCRAILLIWRTCWAHVCVCECQLSAMSGQKSGNRKLNAEAQRSS